MIGLSRLAALLILAVAATAAATSRADLIAVVATADGVAEDLDGDGTFEDLYTDNGTFDLVVRDFAPNLVPFEDRTVLEFDLSAVPAGMTLDSVGFRFTIASVTSSSTTVRILGFAGDGAVTLGDAEAAGAVLLGSFAPATLGLGSATVALDLSALAGALGGGSLLTLVLDGPEPTNTSLASLESAGSASARPALIVSYTGAAAVPEPASVAMLGAGALGLLGYARRRRAMAV